MSTKVALLHNIIAPYRFPLFESLAKQKELELQVFFLSETAKNRKWDWKKYTKQMKFPYKVLPHWSIPLPLPEGIPLIINPTYIWELIRGKYDLVITAGWFDLSCMVTYFLAPLLGYKYIIWSESTNHEKSLQRTLTLPFVKWAVRNAASCIAIGSASKEYLLELGAKPENVVIAYSTVDVDFFARASSLSKTVRLKRRTQLGIPEGAFTLLYVGQFIQRKRVDLLLQAYENLSVKHKALILLGYGPLEDQYKKHIAEKKLQNVFIVPHVEVQEMPLYYALADVFVLPSEEETWGLVVNEALAANLPVIASDKVGSARDLVKRGDTGEVFRSGSAQDLLEKILRYRDDGKRRISTTKSSEIVAMITPTKAAQKFAEAIRLAD